MFDLFLLGDVSAGLYTIRLAHLGNRLKGHELATIFCYEIGMLAGPTIIGQTMDIFKPFVFSIAIACFFAIYSFALCSTHEKINQLLTFFRTSVVLPRKSDYTKSEF
ncbi:hypothetical protein [Bartonella rattaustraliani]|uniref:hypothetical protein n=1 Tax=Bartonella rattaustraliani TaxID=481139 RepID=UPI000A006517|nr:hypothetical protein [Bartonella rattaustraliani]